MIWGVINDAQPSGMHKVAFCWKMCLLHSMWSVAMRSFIVFFHVLSTACGAWRHLALLLCSITQVHRSFHISLADSDISNWKSWLFPWSTLALHLNVKDPQPSIRPKVTVGQSVKALTTIDMLGAKFVCAQCHCIPARYGRASLSVHHCIRRTLPHKPSLWSCVQKLGRIGVLRASHARGRYGIRKRGLYYVLISIGLRP